MLKNLKPIYLHDTLWSICYDHIDKVYKDQSIWDISMSPGDSNNEWINELMIEIQTIILITVRKCK